MTPCAACPCDDPGRCPGTGNAHLCGIAARGTAAGLDHVRALAGEPPRGLPGARPLAATLEVLDLIRGCDHRWPDPTACSCTSAAYCSLRSATVFPPDCDSCRSR